MSKLNWSFMLLAFAASAFFWHIGARVGVVCWLGFAGYLVYDRIRM